MKDTIFDRPLPAWNTSEYWQWLHQVANSYAQLVSQRMVTHETMRVLLALERAYPRARGVLDLAAVLLASAFYQCPKSLRAANGLPDLDKLIPVRPDAVTVLTVVSKANAFLGHVTVAADIEAAERQVLVHERMREVVENAWSEAQQRPRDPASTLAGVVEALSVFAGDARATSALLAIASGVTASMQ